MAFRIGRHYTTTWFILITGIGMFMSMVTTPMLFLHGAIPGTTITDITTVTTLGTGTFQ